MSGQNLEEFLAGCDLDQIKHIIFTLVTQYFPYMEDTERQELILKLLGESGPDKLSSMVYR